MQINEEVPAAVHPETQRLEVPYDLMRDCVTKVLTDPRSFEKLHTLQYVRPTPVEILQESTQTWRGGFEVIACTNTEEWVVIWQANSAQLKEGSETPQGNIIKGNTIRPVGRISPPNIAEPAIIMETAPRLKKMITASLSSFRWLIDRMFDRRRNR